MYEINLYPEYERKLRESRHQRIHGAIFGASFGVSALILLVLFLSSHLLRERVEILRESTARMAALVEGSAQSEPELPAAKELLRLRQRRIDWSPKLAALAEVTDPTITLTRVDGRLPAKGISASLELMGELGPRATHLEQVSAFMNSLASDQRVSLQLPAVELGNLKGSEDGRFMVTCAPGEGGS